MDTSDYFRGLASLVFVLALIGLIFWAWRRFGSVRRALGAGNGRRLQVVEVAPVDARRRLVLVRRDATEHLVLIGAQSELVIETDIPAPPAATAVGPAGKTGSAA